MVKNVFAICVAVYLFLVCPSYAGAALGDARVDVTVVGDTATLVWTLPCTKDTNKAILSYSYDSVGQTGVSLDYVSATANGEGWYVYPGGTESQEAALNCGNGGTAATFTYTTESKVKGAGIVIEFPVFHNTYTFDSVDVFVKVPGHLNLLNASHPYTMANGSAVFRFQAVREADVIELDILLLSFAKNPLPRGFEHKRIGPYEFYGQSRSMRVLEGINPYINELTPFYKKIMGVNLDARPINVFVTDLGLIATEYSAAGVALTKDNLILMDSAALAEAQPVDLVKLLVHETAHILVGTSGIFSNQPVYVEWFDEGVSVFAEQYFTDTYLSKDKETRLKHEALSSYPKFSTTTLATEYKREFDAYFAGPDQIKETYAHAGLLFYKAFIDDPVFIKNMIIQLKNEITYAYCESCAPEKVMQLYLSLVGLPKEKAFYPFKDMAVIPEKYKILFAPEIDEATAKKILADSVKNSTAYFSTSTKPAAIKSEVPVKTVEPVVEKKVVPVSVTVSAATTTPIATTTAPVVIATSSASSTPVVNMGESVVADMLVTVEKENIFMKIFFAPARLIRSIEALLRN